MNGVGDRFALYLFSKLNMSKGVRHRGIACIETLQMTVEAGAASDHSVIDARADSVHVARLLSAETHRSNRKTMANQATAGPSP
jgi:hypothetical protein